MSCSVYDAVELETRGVPTVAVHTTAFLGSADAHALAFGRPDYRSVGIRHPIGGLGRGEVIERADEVIDEIVARLTGRVDESV